ncbi:MAG TPA: hypothetical protein VK324_04350 [Tepidisphaeraceae bacterium]|nr:hypothetical protein [Tepidisphaeraceae bacterium]
MEVPKELKVARDLAERTAEGGGRVAIFAREMAALLVRVEEQLTGVQTPVAVSRAVRGRQERAEYVVEVVGKVQTLAEHRTSGKSKPFRCPKSVYDAVAKVVGEGERALGVEEIASAVERELQFRPAEFQVRVSLRLWLSVEPPLVERVRARYRSVGGLAEQAARLWERLRVH